MNAYNPYVTPYFPNYAGMTQPVVNPGISYASLPQTEIDKVSGEESARAYPIGPNSSAIVLDTKDPLVWVITTDASGYKTVTPFTITPYTPEKPVSASDIKDELNTVIDRLNRLEAKINNEQSNYVLAGEDKPGDANVKSNGRNAKGGSKSSGSVQSDV